MDGTVNIRFVISKDVDFVADGYTKASKSIPQNINMLHTCKGRKKPEQYVAVSIVICFLYYQLSGVLWNKWSMTGYRIVCGTRFYMTRLD